MTTETQNTLDQLRHALDQLQRELPTLRRNAEVQAANERAGQLLSRALHALRRFPTQGEAATWLGRRTEPLLALEATLEKENLLLARRHTHELLHAFWKPERTALLSEAPEAATRIQEILARPADAPHNHSNDAIRYSRDLIDAIDPDHVHGLDDAWRKLATSLADRFPQEQADLCRDIVRAAKLDPIDEAALLAQITRSLAQKALYGYKTFFRDDLAGRRVFLQLVGLESGGDHPHSTRVFVTCPSDATTSRAMPCEQAFTELVARPDAFLETGFEQGVRRDLLPRLAKNLASTDELDDVTVFIDDTMDGGLLNRVGRESPFRQEAIFRFFEAIGLDPRQDAAFVTEGREVGSGRYPGTWHLYPVAERGYVLALGMDEFHRGRLDAQKGSLETVKARLAHSHAPSFVPGRSDADNRRLSRELDPAPARHLNFFKEYANVFGHAFLTAQYALRAQVEEAFAKP